jgi:hypothetical protein
MPELVPVDDDPFSTAVSGTDPIFDALNTGANSSATGREGRTILRPWRPPLAESPARPNLDHQAFAWDFIRKLNLNPSHVDDPSRFAVRPAGS